MPARRPHPRTRSRSLTTPSASPIAQLTREGRRARSRSHPHRYPAGRPGRTLLPAGLDFARCFWAVQRAGAVSIAFNPYTPVRPPRWPGRRASRPSLTLLSAHRRRFRPRGCERGTALHALEDVPRVAGDAPNIEVDPERSPFSKPTSGTSGESRAVMIRHRNVMAVLRSYRQAYYVDTKRCDGELGAAMA